jgi:N-acetylglucosaminyl-diphospho-decaprenol L-rhamnosyltransferase
MAVRRRIFAQLGGLDAERFFLYWEETDFCRRVRLAGGRVLFCPHLRCRHLGGASAAQAPRSRLWFWRGLYAYHRKHRGPAYAALIWTLLIPGIAAEWLVLTALHGARRGRDPKLRSDRRELAARLGAQLEILARSPPEVGGGR